MQQSPFETQVKTYTTPRHYQKDAKQMAKAGWTVTNATNTQRGANFLMFWFVPLGYLNKRNEIVVTYQRALQPNAQPAKPQIPPGLSFKEQIRWHLEQNKKR